MWEHQADLPRLAIPELQHTCDRYLAALAPLSGLTESQKRAAELTVKEFLEADGAGTKLNSELQVRYSITRDPPFLTCVVRQGALMLPTLHTSIRFGTICTSQVAGVP
jgi:hypothetical protein